ncbi:bacitracin ABC transporter ATP-binding protein [Alphaproteobacteria bacterium]|nr:bacitracin ABC transporter ATP-binding protein [Alphaproteobacteria bacterium]
MGNVMLSTKNLTKQYGEFTALDSVSLTLRKGDIYGLVGRNGAGKTTFFKCVMGLAKSTSGEIAINGSTAHLGAGRRRIGFLINSAFFPYLDPRQNLEYLCRVKGVNPRGEVTRLLKLVGLYGVKKTFKEFSMGMKQRLGLAGALLGRPPIVILDEPVNGLDPQGIADIREIIKRENKENGTTFIVSSHILGELDLVATRFGFIEQGKLLQEISHEDLHRHTQKSLIIEVDDTKKALRVLEVLLKITDAEVKGGQIILEKHINRSAEIASALVGNGLKLHKLAPRETTLEEYFINLIEGKNA